MDQSTYHVRLESWKQLIDECNNSNLSKREWCRQSGIDEKTFYYRQRQVRKYLLEQIERPMTNRIAIKESVVASPLSNSLIEVSMDSMMEEANHTPDIVIQSKYGAINLYNSASAELVEKVLKVFAYA